MPYIPPEQVAQAKEMDLLTYLQLYDPEELVHVAGNEYSTRTHDSLKISNGLWCWNSRGIAGRSALDYLVKVHGMGFLDATEHILREAPNLSPQAQAGGSNEPPASSLPTERRLLLPPAAPNNDRVIAYLTGRGIDRGIIDFCIQTRRLYQSADYSNAVFVGMDKAGAPRYAALRGTKSSFKGEASGSDKRYSFSVPAEASSTLHLFESAIDLLSFATLFPEAWHSHLLSLAGVFTPAKNTKARLPVALACYLEDYPEIQHIDLHLDNDLAGRAATQNIFIAMGTKHSLRNQRPVHGKDVNDELRYHLVLKAPQANAMGMVDATSYEEAAAALDDSIVKITDAVMLPRKIK